MELPKVAYKHLCLVLLPAENRLESEGMNGFKYFLRDIKTPNKCYHHVHNNRLICTGFLKPKVF